MKTINKILCIISVIIIVAGIIVWKNKRFNLEFEYSARNQITLSNNTSINKSDIEQIISEVLGNQKYIIQEVETFGNIINIVADEITDEQKNEIVKKFNEKYGTDIDKNKIGVISIPSTMVKDAIKPLIKPGIITFVVLLLYFLVRFKRLGLKTILSKIVIIPVVAELLLYSIIVISRIPFGKTAIACSIGLYVIIIFILTNKFENDREKSLAQKQEQ